MSSDAGTAALAWPSTAKQMDAALLASAGTADAAVEAGGVDGLDVATRLALLRFLDRLPRRELVLVKTSTVGGRSASHEVTPHLLNEILETVLQAVAVRSVLLCDGPVYGNYLVECDRLGWTAATRRLDIKVLDLNEQPSDSCILGGYPVADAFLQADAVVNVVKVKTHRRFGVSLAEKSLLGVLGNRGRRDEPKIRRHTDVPWLLAALIHRSPPAFSILDGRRGIEGNGPLRGIPTASRFLVHGTGYTGPDLRASVEMGFDPVLVPLFLRPRESSRSTASMRASWRDLRVTQRTSSRLHQARGCTAPSRRRPVERNGTTCLSRRL